MALSAITVCVISIIYCPKARSQTIRYPVIVKQSINLKHAVKQPPIVLLLPPPRQYFIA